MRGQRYRDLTGGSEGIRIRCGDRVYRFICKHQASDDCLVSVDSSISGGELTVLIDQEKVSREIWESTRDISQSDPVQLVLEVML
jgi:hypothetical protein